MNTMYCTNDWMLSNPAGVIGYAAAFLLICSGLGVIIAVFRR